MVAAAVGLVAGTPLVIASELTPAAAGVGTHRELGLPACGWQTAMDLPCPTCGMTTAFTHAVRGDLAAAAITQPAGLMLCLAAACAVVGAAYVVATGATVHRLFGGQTGARLGWAALAGIVIAWAFKLAQAGAAT